MNLENLTFQKRKKKQGIRVQKEEDGSEAGRKVLQTAFLTRHWSWFQPSPNEKVSSLCFL